MSGRQPATPEPASAHPSGPETAFPSEHVQTWLRMEPSLAQAVLAKTEEELLGGLAALMRNKVETEKAARHLSQVLLETAQAQKELERIQQHVRQAEDEFAFRLEEQRRIRGQLVEEQSMLHGGTEFGGEFRRAEEQRFLRGEIERSRRELTPLPAPARGASDSSQTADQPGAQEQVASLQAEVDGLIRRKEELTAAVAALQETCDQLSRELVPLRKELGERVTAREALIQDIQILQEYQNQFQAAAAEHQNAVAQLTAERARQQTEVQATATKLAKRHAERKSESSKLKALRAECVRVQAELENLRQSYAALQSEHAAVTKAQSHSRLAASGLWLEAAKASALGTEQMDESQAFQALLQDAQAARATAEAERARLLEENCQLRAELDRTGSGNASPGSVPESPPVRAAPQPASEIGSQPDESAPAEDQRDEPQPGVSPAGPDAAAAAAQAQGETQAQGEIAPADIQVSEFSKEEAARLAEVEGMQRTLLELREQRRQFARQEPQRQEASAGDPLMREVVMLESYTAQLRDAHAVASQADEKQIGLPLWFNQPLPPVPNDYDPYWLQSEFFTDEPLDAQKVTELVAQMPGLDGCLVVKNRGPVLACRLAEHYFEQLRAPERDYQALFGRLPNRRDDLQLPQGRVATYQLENGFLTVTQADHIFVITTSAQPRLRPGMPEKLTAIAHELGKMYPASYAAAPVG